MTVYLEFAWSGYNDDLKDYLKRKELTVIKNGKTINVDDDFRSLEDGMALRHKSGVVMRVMGNRFSNYENLSNDHVLASKSTKDEHRKLFEKW
jgi:hypothetical protein